MGAVALRKRIPIRSDYRCLQIRQAGCCIRRRRSFLSGKRRRYGIPCSPEPAIFPPSSMRLRRPLPWMKQHMRRSPTLRTSLEASVTQRRNFARISRVNSTLCSPTREVLMARSDLRIALAANNAARYGKIGRYIAFILKQANRVLFCCDISIGARIESERIVLSFGARMRYPRRCCHWRELHDYAKRHRWLILVGGCSRERNSRYRKERFLRCGMRRHRGYIDWRR